MAQWAVHPSAVVVYAGKAETSDVLYQGLSSIETRFTFLQYTSNILSINDLLSGDAKLPRAGWAATTCADLAWADDHAQLVAAADARLTYAATTAVSFWSAATHRAAATLDQVLDHIDHVKELIGVEHIGIGSDYDGVGDSLPVGLKDVSSYPNLVQGLLDRGYTDEEIKMILGGNLMRVWQQVEEYAK